MVVTAGGVVVSVSNITWWTIYIRKIEGVARRISLLDANVARIILKRYLILENRRKILDSKGFVKNSL